MKISVSVHPLNNLLEHARKIYLTAFWRITPAALTIFLILTSACGSNQPVATSLAAQATAPATPKGPASSSRPTQKVTPSAHPPTTPTLAVNAPRLEGVHIRFWYVLPGGLPENAQANPMMALVDEFNRTNSWGITVESAHYESYEELIQQVDSPQGGDRPDLLVGYSYQLRSLDASTHLLVDLAPYIQEPRWGLSAQEQAGFNPLFWQQDVVSGKRLGLPFSRSAQLLYYNLSQAKDLGFTSPPATPSEFATQACAAAQANRKDPDVARRGTGGWAVNSDIPTMEGWLYAFGNAITSPDGQSYALSTTQTTQALTFLKNLFDKGCAWSAEDAFPKTQFASRQAMFIAGNLEELDAQAKAFEAADSKDAWTVIPFLSPEGKPAIIVYGPSFAVLQSNPETQLAAWLFIRWVLSLQNQASWIENNGTLPLGAGVLPLLEAYKSSHSQWAAALELLPDARLEPQMASWGEVRWSLGDAGARLFSPLFPANLVPQMVAMLNDTAAELKKRGP
jgi:multiple sugar transport system substrate-binding protein